MSKQEQQLKIERQSINFNDSMLVALKRMDQIDKKLLLVFEDGIFNGLLSIGDIQRAIINNKALDTPVHEILRKNIKVANISDDRESIIQTMIRFRTECMPILDEKGNLYDVVFWEDIFPGEKHEIERNLNFPVVIMAGGKGVRLRPITNILPKALIPLDKKTILEHIMDLFLEIGCNQFFISVNYKADFIRYYFDSLGDTHYNIHYFQEDEPLGTIGSLYLLKKEIQSTFFVSNCDILINQDYGAIYDYHAAMKNELTLVAALKHIKIPYGTIETTEGGQLTALVEKPELTYKINSGLYILEPHLIDEISDHEFLNITDLIDRILLRNGRVGVFPVSEKSWKDIGEWSEYLRISKKFSDDDPAGR